MGNTYQYAVTSFYFEFVESTFSEIIKIEISSIILGDVNGDLFFNIVDIIMILNFIIGNNEPTTSEFMVSDMNEDGNINVVDIVAIVNVILGD